MDEHMRKILLALHGGPSAEGAARIAFLLHERTGAPVEAIGVVEPPLIVDYGFGPVYIPDAASDDDLEQEMRAEIVHQLARCGLGTVTLTMLHGPRVTSIASVAAARKASLVVVGLGPRRFVDRALGGETAIHLAQNVATPVLAVPAGMTELPHRVVAAVDFSTASLAATRFAVSLLRPCDAVELAHIGSAVHIGRLSLGPMPTRDATQRLASFAREIELPNGVEMTPLVLAGEPARVLLEHVAHAGGELIALGSHGYSPWQRLVLGSVSSRVLRLAECAVLIYQARCVTGAGPMDEWTTKAAAPLVSTV
jgi:nucleotide-binding universal stress UspA family protein